MTPQELAVELESDCTSVARGVARGFDGTVDWEDVRQELLVYVLTHPNLDPEKRPGVRKILGRVAEAYCQKQRAQALYLSPQYHYTRDRLRYLLDQWGASSYEFKPADDAGIENDSLGSIDELVDLTYGLAAISEDELTRICDVHIVGVKHENGSAGRKAYDRAVEKLLRKMNSYFYQRTKDYEGPGARDVVSTSAARTIVRSDYSGEGQQEWRLDRQGGVN